MMLKAKAWINKSLMIEKIQILDLFLFIEQFKVENI